MHSVKLKLDSAELNFDYAKRLSILASVLPFSQGGRYENARPATGKRSQ